MDVNMIFRRVLLAVALGSPVAAFPGIADVLASRLGEVVREETQARWPGAARGAAPSNSDCSHFFPAGRQDVATGLDARWKPTLLCSSSFAVVHSGLTKTPLVAVERLNAAILRDARDEQRTNEFYPDARLPRGQRSELHDFAGSSYDRGHMAPAADAPNQAAMHESFALSNMVPQDATNNRKVWSKVESDTRRYIRRAKGDVFVFTGPLFLGQVHRVGRSQVWVPSHLFKLVYDQTSGRSWAYVLPNTSDAQVGPPMSYEQFLRDVKWDLLAGASGR